MQFLTFFSAGCLLTIAAAQADSSLVLTGSNSEQPTGSVTDLPSGTYLSYSSTITLTGVTRPAYGSMSSSTSTTMAGNTTASNSTATTSSSNSLTLLGGTVAATGTAGNSTTGNATSSASASASPQPTNTTPCNNYPEFCGRKYSNITMVAAHNSPFDITGNAASNQKYSSIQQLDDGIRLLQTESHWPNETVYLCHTDCNILNAGSLESWLTEITGWVESHPYDVVTLLIGNQEFHSVEDYVTPFQNSGITKYVYTPTQFPLGLDDWPTLSNLILTRQRVVVFMDYEADQTKVPWILDEFSQMWETPFNPTDNTFPCTVQRPPNLSDADAKDRLYLLNNNLNTEITLLGQSLLVPNTVALAVTNAANGTGSLGESSQGCYEDWGRAPNFLDVDYYNVGNGSVFEVAAKWNNVTYTRSCCGVPTSAGERTLEIVGRAWVTMCVVVVMTCWLLM